MAAFLTRPAPVSPGMETEGEFSYEISNTGNNSMKVVVRVRPESEPELRSSCHCVVKVLDEHVLIFDPAGHQTSGASGDGKKPFLMSSPGMSRFFGGRRLRPLLAKKHKDLRFAFDRVFDETSTQTQVFKHATQSILDGVLDGINCSVFAYGATGAGKTHTMLGSPEQPGVIFLTMRELYHRIDVLRDSKTFTISISYCEVYNETIRDLLAPSGSLNLREDSEQGLVVSGLSSHIPNGAEEILAMLERGNGNRTQHPTEANATSSRSHAVFQVMVEQRPRTAGLSADVTQAKLSLIDLAGSERATITANKGARLREGANINRSLLALGNCINALAASKGKPGYVPYRDSKLTRLLKDSLGGNCRTVMVANVSPSALCYEDTYNTLKYADRAKQIKTTLVRNVLHVDYHLSKYKVIIQDLQKEIIELKGKISSASSQTAIYDPKEAARLCGMVGDVYGERGRLRKHMADLDAKERETLLKVCRKERDLSRIELLWTSDVKKGKITSRICALRAHLTDIQRQKQTVNEYLFSNNETVGRVQKEVNNVCKEHQGGDMLLQLLESVTEARKLEVESGYQWKQTKHLLKYIKNQEREIARTERLLCLSLSIVQRQHRVIQDAALDSSHLQDDLSCLSGLAQGDKGVAWADQTRISTNDLHDVSTASLSGTQQQLFDCFLEHSSPRLSRKFFPPKTGPHLSPHLGILTSMTAAKAGKAGNQSGNETALEEESDEGSTTPTPTSSQGSGGTLTLRTSHIFSAHTPPHHAGGSGSSQSSSLAKQTNTSNSVRVTTDVCFSSTHRPPPSSPSSSCYSERDDISEVSSSGLGSTNSDPMNSDPLQDQDDELDYDKLVSMSRDLTRRSHDLTGRSHEQIGRSHDLTGIIQQSATHYKWHRPLPPATPTNRGMLYQNRPGATPYHSTSQSSIEATPTPRGAGTLSAPPVQRRIPVPSRRELATPPAPQPYSKFQPLRPPPRPSKGTPTSSNMTTPTYCTPPTSLGSHKSISTDSGLGSITGGIVPQGPGGMLRRTPLLPPHRPNANGVMVRSSPSNTLPHSSHVSNFSYATRITGFEDNFVSPPSSSRQQCHPESMPSKDSHVTVPVKVPIGALMSPLHRPFGTRAAPNPYVQDPGHQPRPLTGTLSTGNISNGSVYMYQEAPPKSTAFSSGRGFAQPAANRSLVKSGHKSLSKQTSLSGSKVNLSDIEGRDDHALNSTFTVAVDVGCRGQQAGMSSRVAGSTCGSTASSSSSDGGKKPGQGRGMFGRNKISKLPSYQKMTKSAESKKSSRVQNKENVGQQSTGTHSNGHLRLNKVSLNRSRDGLNSTGGNSSITMSTRFNSAPQLAW